MELRLRSALPEATERVVRDTIGCAIEVHRRLGPGLLEAIYADALAIERMLPLYQAQVISCLKASGLRVGLLVNFNSSVLKEGLRRIVV